MLKERSYYAQNSRNEGHFRAKSQHCYLILSENNLEHRTASGRTKKDT